MGLLEDVMDMFFDYVNPENGEVGYFRSIVIGLFFAVFVWIVLALVSEFVFPLKEYDWIMIGVPVVLGALVTLGVGPYRDWNWGSVLVTFPIALIPWGIYYLMRMYNIDFQLITTDVDLGEKFDPNFLVFAVISIVVWWVANKLVQRRFF